MPKKQKFTGSFYTTDQIDKLLQLVRGTTIENSVFLTVYYGFRRGEALGLRWQDINFLDNTLTIQNTRVKIIDDTVKQPKSEASRRALPLIPTVKEYLEKLKEQQETDKKLMGNCYIENDYICKW